MRWRQLLYVAVVTLLTSLVLAGGNILYTNHVQHESDQRWCALMAGLDERYQKLQPPPADATEQQRQQYRDAVDFAVKIQRLRRQLGC